MGNLKKHKAPISQYWRGYSNIFLIFSDWINIFQRLLVFSSSTDKVLAVGLLVFCPFRKENLEPWNYSRMNFRFPNIVAVVLIFWFFFWFYEYLSKTSSTFKFQRPNFGCLIGFGVSHSVLAVFWDPGIEYIEWKSHFSLFQGLFWYCGNVFRFF